MDTLYDLPKKSDNLQIFTQSGFWYKPQGITMVHIFAVGGGAGGGGGQVYTAGVGGGGGSGGGSAASGKIIFPAKLLPDILYVNVGVGGLGGASISNGSNGTASYVIYPNAADTR